MHRIGWVAVTTAGVLIIALLAVVVVTWDGVRALRPMLAVLACAATAWAVTLATMRHITQQHRRALVDAAVRRMDR